MLFCCYFFQSKKCAGANVYAIFISDLVITYISTNLLHCCFSHKKVGCKCSLCLVRSVSHLLRYWLWADLSYCDLAASTHFAIHTLVIEMVVKMGNWDFFIIINDFLLVTLSHTLEIEMVLKMGNWDFFIAIHFCLPFVKYSFLCNFHKISFFVSKNKKPRTELRR